ncbi:MAG: membrane protein insertase YidC [Gammaproteobacteria bacterium HGW-Gammaproteobacteria-4]|jgi:YidC/Oxa1 family membrane protein insertase|nr:MAG: membrane protein insertase YidC [Gammaproteobacteria bacterium HGW-Gammaproteobacteria-4]
MNQTRTFLLLAWLFLAYLLWQAWQSPTPQPVIDATGSPRVGAVDDAAAPQIPIEPSAPLAGVDATVPTASPIANTTSTRRLVLANDVLRLEIDTRGGTVASAQLLDYGQTAKPDSERVQLLSSAPEHFFVAQSGLVSNKGAAPSHESVFVSAPDAEAEVLRDGEQQVSLALNWSDGNGLSVRKVFTLKRGSYLLSVRDEVDNQSEAAWQGHVYRQLLRVPPVIANSGFNNPEGYSFAGAAWYSPDEKFEKLKFDKLAEEPLNRKISGGWIAMLQHHFMAVWIPGADESTTFSTAIFANGVPRYVIREVGPALVADPGARVSTEARLWVGPKLQSELPAVAPGLERTIDYGIFTLISDPLFAVLSFLHRLFGNWGWAIIGLVVLIKAVFFKLSEKQYLSMAKMRKLQPRIEALKERYGEDKQKFQQAMLELYKKEKANPASGCLPILIQIPVFIALYWVLLESVELRHAPWIGWIHSLTDRDPYFVLPVLNMASMYFTQKLSPAPGMDPIQKKFMQLMPLIFGVMFAFFPAGLVLYWTTNGSLGLLQQWVIMRRHGDQADKPAVASKD